MTEAEFQAMLTRASQKKADAQEHFQANSQRRAAVLAKAIQTHRVTPGFSEIATEPQPGDLRRRFDSEMNRLMRTHVGSQVGEASDDSGQTDSDA